MTDAITGRHAPVQQTGAGPRFALARATGVLPASARSLVILPTNFAVRPMDFRAVSALNFLQNDAVCHRYAGWSDKDYHQSQMRFEP